MGPSTSSTSYVSSAPTAATPTQNLVWLEDARSRGLAPVMKTNGSQPGYAENAPDRPVSPRSWTDAEGEPESDAEMESEADTRPPGSGQPQYQLRDDSSRAPPSYGRAYTHHSSREGQAHPSYPPREAHPSYAAVGNSGPKLDPDARRGSASVSASPRSTPSAQHLALARSASPQNSNAKTRSPYPHSSSGPQRRRSTHSHPESEDDALGSDPARETTVGEDEPESESDDRPAKRSRRENEHARENVGGESESARHRSSPEREQTTA